MLKFVLNDCKNGTYIKHREQLKNVDLEPLSIQTEGKMQKNVLGKL